MLLLMRMARYLSLSLSKKKYYYLGLVLVVLSLIVFFLSHRRDSYYVKIPLKFNESNLPCVDVSIEDTTFLVVLDTGSKLEISLSNKIMSNITKIRTQEYQEWMDIYGKVYTSSKFLIPNIKLGAVCFNNIIAVEEEEEEEGVFIGKKRNYARKTYGDIGKRFLTKKNFLIDAKKALLIFADRVEKIKKEGYDMSLFVKVPINISGKHISLETETILGKKKFTIDTGSTLSFFNSRLLDDREPDCHFQEIPGFRSTNCIINNYNFGEVNLYPIKCGNAVDKEFTGFFGMDFLINHPIYFDFEEGFAYIYK